MILNLARIRRNIAEKFLKEIFQKNLEKTKFFLTWTNVFSYNDFNLKKQNA